MVKILLLILFCFPLWGQTYLAETFSNFIPDTTATNIDLMYPLDGTNFSPTYGNRAGSGDDLTTLLAQTTAGQIQQSVLVENGYSEDFQGSGTITLVNNTILNETGSKSIALIVNMDALSERNTWQRTIMLQLYVTGISNSARAVAQFAAIGASAGVKPSSSKSIDTWYVFVGIYNTTGPALDLYVDGVASVEAATGTIPVALNGINERMNLSGIASGASDFNGQLDFFALYNTALTAKQARVIGFLPQGWVALDSNVTRNNFGFHLGVITDTVYYNTALTAGNWSVSVDVDGNSGGETYQILTSADKSTWTALKSASAPASSTTVTATGAGLGYIGLAVSSAADTVFFDNLTVSEVTATTSGKFKGSSGWSRFKGF